MSVYAEISEPQADIPSESGDVSTAPMYVALDSRTVELYLRNLKESPACRLPAEILCMVFRFLVEIFAPVAAPGHIGSTPGWLTVGWVCSKWRCALVSDAYLWAKQYSDHPPLASLARQRAGNVPLDYVLSADIPSIHPTLGMETMDDKLMIDRFVYSTDFTRCSLIEVRDNRAHALDHLVELADISQEKGLPLLVELVLHQWAYSWSGYRAELLSQGHDCFAIEGSALRHVQLHNCFTVIKSPVLSSLSYIFDHFNPPRPKFDVLYKAIQPLSGGGLTYLELVNVVSASTKVDATPFMLNPVHLPRLETFIVTGYARIVSKTLRMVAWPRCGTKLRVHAYVRELSGPCLSDEVEVLRACFPHRGDILALNVQLRLNALVPPYTIVNAIDHTKPFGIVPTTSITFAGSYTPCEWYRTAEAAISACGSGGIIIFSLTIPRDEYEEPDIPWVDLLTSMKGLSHIHPYRKIMASIGPVDDGHALGRKFRERVKPFSPVL